MKTLRSFSAAIILASFAFITTISASGSYSNRLQNRVFPQFDENGLYRALKDDGALVSSDFSIPSGLEDDVEFWLRIYTQYTSYHVVIFDEEHPNIVYEVMDLRNELLSSRNGVVYELIAKKKIREKMALYRSAYKSLSLRSKLNDYQNLSREEANIINSLSSAGIGANNQCSTRNTAKGHCHTFSELSEAMRTQTGQRENVLDGLAASNEYMPKMQTVFREMNLPTDLVYLSLVESSFNYSAVSKKGAVGVWQFMPASGSEYLTVDHKMGLDERLSPLKSTSAAARLLTRNFKLLGNWPLAVTAFNHGHRNLVRVRDVASSPSDFSLLTTKCEAKAASIKSPLGFASRNYYSGFLALLRAVKYRSIFFPSIQPSDSQLSLDFQMTKSGDTLVEIANRSGLDVAALQKVNPDIIRVSAKLPEGILIAIPVEKSELNSSNYVADAKLLAFYTRR